MSKRCVFFNFASLRAPLLKYRGRGPRRRTYKFTNFRTSRAKCPTSDISLSSDVRAIESYMSLFSLFGAVHLNQIHLAATDISRHRGSTRRRFRSISIPWSWYKVANAPSCTAIVRFLNISTHPGLTRIAARGGGFPLGGFTPPILRKSR